MGSRAAASIVLGLFAATGLPAQGATDADDGAALARLEADQSGLFARVAPSVVLIVGEGASGSGFVVAPEGLVLTNAHVVGGADEVAIQLLDGRHGRGRVLARATGALDLALVRAPFADLQPLRPGDPGAARAGTFAATVGHGGGAAWTFSTGLVANPKPVGDGAPLILAQMALRPGSSGGPLVDRQGRALAVVTAGTRDASGVTFAIRIDAAAAAFPQLADWLAPRAPAQPSRALGDGGGPAITAADGDARITDVARLSSAAKDGPSAASPLVTVWEAPRRSHRGVAERAVARFAVPSHVAAVRLSSCHAP